MPTVRRSLVVLALTAGFALSGCKKQAATDDASVTAAVQARIASDSALGPQSIQASALNGVVTLTGAVSSDAARALAANDAAQAAGVRTVINSLSVTPAAPQAAMVPEPAPEPAVIAPQPQQSRVRTLPARPAPVERQKIPRETAPPQPAPAAVQQALDRPAPQAAPVPQQPSFRNVEVPAGTSIPVRITQTLDSATTQQGETFSGTVASDVVIDGLVVLPQGSAVSGRVDAVQEAAHFKGNSLLTVELTSVSRRGERIPISTEAYSKEGAGRGKNTAVKTGAGAAAGAILGGIFGGGKGAAIGAAAGGGTGAGINAVTRGQQVQIPSESIVPFRLSGPVTVRTPLRGDSRNGDDSSQRRPLSN